MLNQTSFKKGHLVPVDWREKIRNKLKGQTKGEMSEEQKEKIRRKLLNHPVSLETRVKISQRNKGKQRKRGYHLSEEHKQKIREKKKGQKIPKEVVEKIRLKNIGKKRSEETKKKLSLGKLGDKNPAKKPEVRLAISNTLTSFYQENGNIIGFQKGNLLGKTRENSTYSGDWITPENQKIRISVEYRLWREAVFMKDDWTCQKYGTRGGSLHPHHILNFAQYPELRFDVDNGITFSEKAHRVFHKRYGTINNTREQVEEFLLEKDE